MIQSKLFSILLIIVSAIIHFISFYIIDYMNLKHIKGWRFMIGFGSSVILCAIGLYFTLLATLSW